MMTKSYRRGLILLLVLSGCFTFRLPSDQKTLPLPPQVAEPDGASMSPGAPHLPWYIQEEIVYGVGSVVTGCIAIFLGYRRFTKNK